MAPPTSVPGVHTFPTVGKLAALQRDSAGTCWAADRRTGEVVFKMPKRVCCWENCVYLHIH